MSEEDTHVRIPNTMAMPHSERSNKRKAANGITNSSKELNLDFVCPICFEIYEEAQVTKCGHTFCFKCITDSLKEVNKCPQCNFAVDQFYPNFLLNELVSKYKKTKLEEKKHFKNDPNKKNCELQRILFEKRDELSICEIDELMSLLQSRKNQIEEDSHLIQNDLLKDFIEQTLHFKRNQFELMKEELAIIEKDHKELSLIESKLNTDTSTDGKPSKVECQGNSSASTNKPPSPTPGCSKNHSDGNERPMIAAYNSFDLGICDHLDPKTKNSDYQRANLLQERRQRMNIYLDDLQKCYFERCKKDTYNAVDSETRLNAFKSDLNKFTRYSHLRPLAYLNYAKDSASHNIVSSIEFDKDVEFFAIAGVAKKIKIFEYASVVKDSLSISFPTNDIECTSKISCLNWNPFYKSMLATSDYEGSVIIWDPFTGQKLHVFQEHEKRCWSVDFNKVDVNVVASGSDDAKVKLWSTNMESSIATLVSTANICSVKFNPKTLYHLAFASADHRVYYYDLRNTKSPYTVFKEHRKAVSYVKFLNDKELVSASTDSQIKLWNINQSSCIRSYRGHINEKNFVGLTTNDDFIACGSENNSLFVYFKGIERKMLHYSFDKSEKDDNNDFVSAVCWRDSSNIILAANSQGIIMILELV